jgi:hypothetical protein
MLGPSYKMPEIFVLKQTSIFSANLNEISRYKFSPEFIQLEPSSMLTEGGTDRHDEANVCFSQLYKRA